MKLINNYNTKIVSRHIKIEQELKKTISIILHKYLNDPRINFTITISMVRVSKDLSLAKIFISYLDCYHSSVNNFDNVCTIQEIIMILQKSSNYIRRLLSKTMTLRKIPILNFYHDNSLVQGIKISNLLKKKMFKKI